MFVTRKKYEGLMEDLEWEKATSSARKLVVSAQTSIIDKQDRRIEELQAEVYELTVDIQRCADYWNERCQELTNESKRWRDAYERKIDEYDRLEDELDKSRVVKQEQVEDAEARAKKAEDALAAATRISYVVALHENDVPALPRYHSLDTAYGEYMEATKNPSEGFYPYRIFALRGDTIIADVTDRNKWDETLPVSEKMDGYAFLRRQGLDNGRLGRWP